jgi:hypothetical protein
VWTPRGDGNEIESLYRVDTYLDEIGPRLTTDWMLDDIRALP